MSETAQTQEQALPILSLQVVESEGLSWHLMMLFARVTHSGVMWLLLLAQLREVEM